MSDLFNRRLIVACEDVICLVGLSGNRLETQGRVEYQSGQVYASTPLDGSIVLSVDERLFSLSTEPFAVTATSEVCQTVISMQSFLCDGSRLLVASTLQNSILLLDKSLKVIYRHQVTRAKSSNGV